MTEEFECRGIEAVENSYGLRMVRLDKPHGSIILRGYGDLMGFGNWPPTEPNSAGVFVPGKRYRLTVEEL